MTIIDPAARARRDFGAEPRRERPAATPRSSPTAAPLAPSMKQPTMEGGADVLHATADRPTRERSARAFCSQEIVKSDRGARTWGRTVHLQPFEIAVGSAGNRRPDRPREGVSSYRITIVTGDRFAGEWPRDRFRAHGVVYRVATASKTEIYGAFLPLLTSGRVELLDHPGLVTEFLALDRRVARGGRESIDHPRGGRDDLANAAAGAIVTALRPPSSWTVLGAATGPPDGPACPTCGGHHPYRRCPLAAHPPRRS
jgi:hypothetical protein